MTEFHSLVSILVVMFNVFDAALLTKLYFAHRTGNMPHLAAVFLLTLYLGVSVNHLILLYDDQHDLLAGSLIILASQIGTFVVLLMLMRVNLFRRAPEEDA